MCKVFSKTPEWCHWHRTGVSVVDFEQVNVGWLITWCEWHYSNIVKEATKMNIDLVCHSLTQIIIKWICNEFGLIQSRFKSWLLGLIIFTAFFKKEIFDKSTAAVSCT